MPAEAPLKPIRFGPTEVAITRRANGETIVSPRRALPAFPERLSDRLRHWAETAPQRVFLAERDKAGEWRRLTYGAAFADAQRLAAGLLRRGLSLERPVAILSGNSIAHARLALGAMLAGIPYCPVSPAYSLVSQDFAKLADAFALLTPGLVFADDPAAFAKALAKVPADVEIVLGEAVGASQKSLDELAAEAAPANVGADVEAAIAATGPDTIVKFLLTSGSTGTPKAVINTQRMLTANQVMIRETLAFLQDEAPIIVDWLPWNHTFGGNHNFGLVLYNGGTLYIDEGKPVPGLMEASLRNLREIAPSVYFNVPKGYEMLSFALDADLTLRETFFSKLKANFFAGASLSAHVWQKLDALSIAQIGARVPMLTGLGATETAPFSLSVRPETSRSGHVGLPVSGNELKLVPREGKLEARVRGPNVTPGYWRQPELSAKSFDEEGFYSFGDALKPVDPADFSQGFDFDGRISEDFKLASGTWVSVGPLRARFIQAFAPLVRDVVIAGINRDFLGALILLEADGCRAQIPEAADLRDPVALAACPALRAAIGARLAAFCASATGSANRIGRAAILASPPSIDRGEITDKGSINQRAVLECRKDLVEALFAAHPDAEILCA